MKCHYVTSKEGLKVLIPGCWGTVHTNDMDDCYCNNDKTKSYEERVLKLETEVNSLKKQIKFLNSSLSSSERIKP